ncbi:hypothetical protein MSZK_36960 [Mycobacterium sp. shizuoka-1]|nr:hypothetical protein MSZK_36960 [Mycobacterium sp. shizuoka-1]
MAAFGAGAQLVEHPVIDAVLGVDEARKVERVAHASTVSLLSRDRPVIKGSIKVVALLTIPSPARLLIVSEPRLGAPPRVPGRGCPA